MAEVGVAFSAWLASVFSGGEVAGTAAAGTAAATTASAGVITAGDVAAGAALANTGLSVVELLNAPKAPGASTQNNYQQEQQQAAQAQAEALLRRRGMASTILTSPLGAVGATTQKSTLGA